MKKIITILKCPYFVISAAVLLIYGWSLSFGFLYYDDHLNVFENQVLLSGNIIYFWKNQYVGFYAPMVYTIWSCLYKAFGLTPAAFHATNVFFHLLNSSLVYLLSIRFGISKKAALAGALLFAAHPFQVESVAWVTSLKDTSFAFFTLLSIWFFLFSPLKNSFRWLIGFILASAAILCKPTAAVIPVFITVYLLIVSPGSLKNRASVLFKRSGYLFLLLLLGWFSIQMAKAGQSWAGDPKAAVSLFEKPIIMLDSLGFYLLKLVFPVNFYVDYVRYPRNVLDNGLFYLNAFVALLFFPLLILWIYRGDEKKNQARVFAGLLGILFFLPTSGLVTFGHQRISTTADRYMYLVMAGVAIGVAVSLEKIFNSVKGRHLSKIVWFVIAVLGTISFMQSINWKDTALFTENLYEGNPNNFFANRNMGLIYQLKGNDQKALEYFNRANQIDPSHLSTYAAIVSLYFNRHEYDQMDRYIRENLTDEKLQKLEQTPYETDGFYLALAESYVDRKNYSLAMTYLCKAKFMGVAAFASEIDSKMESVKEQSGNVSLRCTN